MNIALTGITGMVGSHFIKKLLEDNPENSTYNIKALIREGSVVEHLKTFEDIDYIIGSLDDNESLAKLVEGAEVLVHLAHFPGPVQTVDELIKVNIDGTFDLLEEARKAKVKQVIFMSSCTVFGEVLPTVNKKTLWMKAILYDRVVYMGQLKTRLKDFVFNFKKVGHLISLLYGLLQFMGCVHKLINRNGSRQLTILPLIIMLTLKEAPNTFP